MNPYGGDPEPPAGVATERGNATARDDALRPKGSPVLAIATVILLGIVTAATVVIAVELRRLNVEQRRETCYARLHWLAPDDDPIPLGVQRPIAAQMCDGSSPRVEFDESTGDS